MALPLTQAEGVSAVPATNLTAEHWKWEGKRLASRLGKFFGYCRCSRNSQLT